MTGIPTTLDNIRHERDRFIGIPETDHLDPIHTTPENTVHTHTETPPSNSSIVSNDGRRVLEDLPTFGPTTKYTYTTETLPIPDTKDHERNTTKEDLECQTDPKYLQENTLDANEIKDLHSLIDRLTQEYEVWKNLENLDSRQQDTYYLCHPT